MRTLIFIILLSTLTSCRNQDLDYESIYQSIGEKLINYLDEESSYNTNRKILNYSDLLFDIEKLEVPNGNDYDTLNNFLELPEKINKLPSNVIKLFEEQFKDCNNVVIEDISKIKHIRQLIRINDQRSILTFSTPKFTNRNEAYVEAFLFGVGLHFIFKTNKQGGKINTEIMFVNAH